MNDRSARVLIIGPGDLGLRVGGILSLDGSIREVVLAGRYSRRVEIAKTLLKDCGDCLVRFLPINVLVQSDVERVLRLLRPDIVIQCAALLSPWWLQGRSDPQAVAIRSAGFAAQLPAQIPLLRSVMQAVRMVGFAGPVINCSFPDLTHCILRPAGLSPTIGIGNVGMIWRRVRSFLREENDASLPLIRVLAHHAHVACCILSQPPPLNAPLPQVYLGECGRPRHDLAHAAPPLLPDRTLNALSASSALPIVRALLPGGSPVRVSTPAPLGLVGGYPVRIEKGKVELDLPESVRRKDAIRFQEQSCRMDGVERIESDGTVIFTEEFRAVVAPIAAELAEPLAPTEALARFRILKEVLEV